jgi:ABC-type polysaccharide/polyol phosphate export permease
LRQFVFSDVSYACQYGSVAAVSVNYEYVSALDSVAVTFCRFTIGTAVFGHFMVLSALGVFIRDVGQTIGLLVTSTDVLIAGLFPLSAIPEKWQGWRG